METGIVERNSENPDERPGAPTIRTAEDTERVAAEQLDEVRQYLRDRYARRDVVARTTTVSGQDIDWVPVESQTADGVASPPDSAAEEVLSDAERTAQPATYQVDGQLEQGPPGTVPLVRKKIDDLRPVGGLQDWLAKGPRRKRLTPPDDTVFPSAAEAVHKYAHAVQFVTCFGTEGFINTWKPFVQWSNEFSLGQLWLVRGAGDARQTLEVGAQTYKDLYGDWEPHLFIFYTTNNYKQMGNNLGGYNQDVDGWVQVSATVFPEMNLAQSVPGGNQFDLGLKVQLSEGNWWVRVGAEWMGYYPASLYNSAGLRSQADIVDWGGEIVDDTANHPEPTATWMGSGHFPPDGWQHAAYMRNLAYQSDAAGALAAFQGFPSVTNPASYNIAVDFSGTSTWGSNFFWGGPGGV